MTKRSLAPLRESREEDILWTSGFYEGEGCCHEARTGLTSVRVSQKDPEILYRLRDWFGGSIQLRDRSKHSLNGVPMKEIYVWSLSGDRARYLLQLIYPWLSARRKAQIDKTSAFTFTGIVRDTRPEMSPERKALRAGMSLKQKMVESQIHYREKNSKTVHAYQRDFARRKKAEAKAETTSIQ
jgi:hypothetical protein